MSDEIKDLAPMPARENRGMVRVGDLLKFAERPDCDPAKMREVYAFAKEVMADEKREEWTRAFVAAKMELDGVKIQKNGAITYEAKPGKAASTIKFLRYDDLAESVKPILRKYNLVAAYDYETSQTPPKTICVLKLMHVNGHTESFRSAPLPMVDEGGGKNATQGAGSVMTYGRRYAIQAAFDIVAEGEDDDGNMGRNQPQPISENECRNLEDVLQELDNREPGAKKRFMSWIEKQFKCSSLGELLDGSQLKAVRTAIAQKQSVLGIK